MTLLQNALAWMLVHSLWQAAILMGVGKNIQWLFRKKAAYIHYNIWVTIFGLMTVSCVATFSHYYSQEYTAIAIDFQPNTTNLSANTAIDISTQAVGTVSLWVTLGALIEANTPYISYLWLVGILLMTLRFAFAFYYLKQLKVRFCIAENGGLQAKINVNNGLKRGKRRIGL